MTGSVLRILPRQRERMGVLTAFIGLRSMPRAEQGDLLRVASVGWRGRFCFSAKARRREGHKERFAAGMALAWFDKSTYRPYTASKAGR